MTLPIRSRTEVANDLRAGIDWYDGQLQGLGSEFFAEALLTFDRISAMPTLGVIVWQDVRFRLVERFPYVVYYRVLTDCVEVIAVLHGRQDSRRWQSRIR